MANTYKNIVITPNRDTDAANVPSIRFSGGDTTSNTDINVRVYTSQSGTLSFEGSAGQLFSITNDLTNTLFSVSDVSGIPSLEIDAAGLVKLTEFGGNVAVGRANASYKVDVAGSVNASSFFINGSPTSIQGVQGIQGRQGIQGTTGTSVQGTTGTSVQGTTGSQGTTGTSVQGTTGTSVQGTTGTSVQGTTGTSIQGSQGIQGLQGTQGRQGIQGANGFQGTTGTSIQGTTGTSIQGSQGIQGLQGTQGRQGIQGANGFQGTTGTSIQGTTGTSIQGTTGTSIQGTTGTSVQGTTGTSVQGTTGTSVQGSTGTQGTRGASDWTPVFSGGVTQSSSDSSTFTKTSGTNSAWDGQVYSQQGYVRGVYATARASQTTAPIMFGLNSDPSTDGSYTSMDYAIYFLSDATIQIYENSSLISSHGAYTASSVFTITYDGVNVRYYRDGTLLRTVARAIGNPLYFDSSFYNTGTSINSVGFGPMGEQGTQGIQGITSTNAAVSVSDTAPSVPANTLWWNSTTGSMYINYNDGDTTQWVEANQYQGVQGPTGVQGLTGTGVQGFQGTTGTGGGGGGASVFSANVGNASANSFNVAHNLAKTFVIPAVRENSSGYYVYPDMKYTTPNHIVLEFVTAPSTNQYTVIVLG